MSKNESDGGGERETTKRGNFHCGDVTHCHRILNLFDWSGKFLPDCVNATAQNNCQLANCYTFDGFRVLVFSFLFCS